MDKYGGMRLKRFVRMKSRTFQKVYDSHDLYKGIGNYRTSVSHHSTGIVLSLLKHLEVFTLIIAKNAGTIAFHFRIIAVELRKICI